jgi:capsular exopolysaccharide synthesis family protein
VVVAGQQSSSDNNSLPPDWYRAASSAYGNDGVGGLLRHAFVLLRRNLWLIGAIIAAGLLLAVLATMLDTRRYQASSTIQINDQGEQVLGDDIEGYNTANAYWDVDRFLNTQLDILRSRGLAMRVAQRLDLFGNDQFFEAMQAPPPGEGMPREARENYVIALLLSGLEVDLPRETRIVTIGFTSTEPVTSAEIANAFAEEYIQANLQRRFDSSAYAREFVAEQLEEARVRLEESERELNTYARQAGLIRTRIANRDDFQTEAGSVTASSLMQLNQAANEAQARRIAAEARWRAENATPLFSSQAVLANSTVQALMTRQAQLRAELESTRARYLPDHPALQQLEAELQSVGEQLQSTGQSVRNSIRADYLAAQSAESSLRAQVSSLEGETLAEQDRAVRYNTLAREADTNRSLYEGLLQRYRQLNASAGIASSNISIIDEAEVPLSPSSPSLFKNLLMGLLAGLGIAGLVVFLCDQLDDVVRIPEDVEDKTGLPLLGVVPRSDDEDIDMALEDPKSALAEAYNSLRGALLYSTRSGLPKIMLVTSAQPTEGKSTSSFAIAAGLARMGRKTLLLDADLRRPAMHYRFRLDNKSGLSSLLVSQEGVASAVFETELEGLSVMPSGPLPPSPTELLTSQRMAAVLDEAAAQYDAVVVDSPPVLGLADAPVLAALADGVVFVIEADRGRSGSLKAAMRRLRAMKPIMLGAVLTKFDPAKLANRYSDYYGYDYYRYDRDGGGKG